MATTDPKTNDDFSVLLPPTSLADLDPGHLCIPVPDPPAFAGAVDGTNATLQIKYLAVFDMPGVNQTFYACSDIIYVNPARFSTFVPCFNSSNFDQQPSATPVPAAPSAGGSKSGLSGGAVAGIVIGVVAGLSALAAAAFFWRKKQRSALRARMDASLRGVRWEDQFASGGRRDPPVPKPVSRSSSGSIGLQAMPK